MRIRTLGTSLFLAIASIGAVTLVTTQVSAIGGGIGGRPAYPDPKNPRTSSIFIYTLEDGTSRSDGIVVANNTTEKQTVELYATDATVSNTGAFTCKQRVEVRSDVGSWVQLAKTEVTLEPATKEVIPFTVQLPGRADVGEHNGCLVIQPKDDEGVVQGNVRIRTRSAIRVSVTVPGDLKRTIAISSFSVTQTGSKQTYNLGIRNTGNVSADIDSKVTLRSLFGASVYENGGGYPVIAGNKLDLNFTNEKTPYWGGFYVADASATYDKRAGTFGTADTLNLTTIHSAKHYLWVTPSSGALTIYGIIILAIASAIGYSVYRRHDKQHTLRKWRSHTVASGETIQSLADKYAVAWQKLAKMNSLKPPYTLETGSKIKVPKNKAKK